jgi:primary-amine oxidase
MAVDRTGNTVHGVDAVRVPISETNHYGNAFTRKMTPLTSEKTAARLTDATVGRTWHIVNPSKTNRLGQPVGYALHPGASTVLLADDESSIHQRATFSTKSLWVTEYDPAEAHLRADPLPAPGGLAGHADRLLRLHPQAGRLLRPQPRAGRAEVGRLALRDR